MSSIRVGIVGLGYWGPNVLRNFAAQEGCEVTWACDLKEENLRKTKSRYPSITMTTRYDDLLEDPTLDLILIATPTSTHHDLAMRALKAGKHIFIEKPMAGTMEEARSITTAAHEAHRLVFVDHTFMFAPAVTRMASLAREGKLGDLLYFDSVRINLGLIQRDTSVLHDLAIHDLSILSTFVDLGDIEGISAYGNRHFGSHIEDAHLHINFRGGFHAHIHASWLSPVKVRRTILAGNRAMLTYDDTEPSEKLRLYDAGVERDTAKTDLSAVASAKDDPFFPKYRAGDIVIPALPNVETLATEAAHVLRCIRGEEQPTSDAALAGKILNILTIADAAMKHRPPPSIPWTSAVNASVPMSGSAATSSSAIS